MRGETIPPTHSCCARISLPRMRGETIPPTHSRCARISLPRMRGETISPTHSRCARISLPRMRGRVGVGARLRDTAGCEAEQRSCAPLYKKGCARILFSRARISLPRMRGRVGVGARLRDTASCEAKQRRGAPLYKGGVRHAALLNVSPNDSMLTAFGFTSQNLPRKSRKLSMRLRACALPVSVW